MARRLINSFTSGALSPLTEGLIDLEGTVKGCRILKNFQVLPSGGVVRRPGMVHREMAHDGAPILVAFNYSAADAFQIEIGDGYFRIIRETGSVVTTPNPIPVGALSLQGEPLRYPAPWTAAQLPRLQWLQANNLLLFFHPEVPPQQILRVAEDDWRMTPVDWKFPPLRDQNISATTLTASVATVGAVGTMTASAATFDAGHVGSTWEIRHVRTAPSEKLTFPAGGTAGVLSPSMRIIGQWEVFTVGRWTGTTTLEQEVSPAFGKRCGLGRVRTIITSRRAGAWSLRLSCG